MMSKRPPNPTGIDILTDLNEPLSPCQPDWLNLTKRTTRANKNGALYAAPRDGQQALAELVKTPEDLCEQPQNSLPALLSTAHAHGMRVVLLGSENPVGKWLNGGQPGDGHNWANFLSHFASIPQGRDSHFSIYETMLVLGDINYDDIEVKLAQTVSEEDLKIPETQFGQNNYLDEAMVAASIACQKRLASVVENICRENLIPICLSGGHEDILGLGLGHIRANPGMPLALANMDAHADYKPIDKRGTHSGNGFLALRELGALNAYAVLGLNALENRAEMLDRMHHDATIWHRFLSDLSLTGDPRKPTLYQATEEMISFLKQRCTQSDAFGLSLCLDVIERLSTVSCPGAIGLTQAQAVEVASLLTESLKPKLYCIAEGMPKDSSPQDRRNLAKIQCQLLHCFVTNNTN